MNGRAENASVLSFVEASAEHARALEGLFDRANVPCHCRYWHFCGDKNAWLARCALEPNANRDEMIRALERATGEMQGIVALAEGNAVGWMKLARSESMQKLYDQRLYKGLPCFDSPRPSTETVGCFLVDERWRRRGVTRGLLDAGIATARRRSSLAIEAFPRRADGVADAEHWMGPFSVFAQAGFRVIHDFGPYPVLRLEL